MTTVGSDVFGAKTTWVRTWISGGAARTVLSSIIIAAIAFSLAITGDEATSKASMSAGEDLTRLLRFMAAIKAVLALGVAGAVLWRLGTAVSPPRFVAYGLACGAMSAGPGLIWSMAHVGLGALLLHGGLLCSIVLLYRDPAVTVRLEAVLVRRLSRLRKQTPRRATTDA